MPMNTEKQSPDREKTDTASNPAVTKAQESQTTDAKKKEVGGRKGPEPTRFGDWELGGKCVDF